MTEGIVCTDDIKNVDLFSDKLNADFTFEIIL